VENLQEYLIENHKKGIVEFSIRAYAENTDCVSFYIHPSNKRGDWLDFDVEENTLVLTGILEKR